MDNKDTSLRHSAKRRSRRDGSAGRDAAGGSTTQAAIPPRTMSNTARWLLLAFVLLGLSAAGGSAYVHYQLLAQPGYVSVCDVNATISCTEVYSSRFASVAGIPIAIGGIVWFVFALLLVLAERIGPRPLGESVPAYLFAISTPALAGMLYLAYASFFILGAVCIFCLLTYVAVIGIFITSGLNTSTPMKTLPRRAIGDLRAVVASPMALAVLVIFLVSAASALAFFPRDTPEARQAQQSQPVPDDKRSEFITFWESQPRVQVPIAEQATVLIVKFTDYQCPSCASTHFDYKPLLAKWEREAPGKVKLVTKDYALEAECNPAIQTGYHLAACEAAAAVRLAARTGHDEAMKDWLYSNFQMLSPAMVREAAVRVGQVNDFAAEYPRVIEAIKADGALGQLLRIRVTPTFFINGIKIEGGLPAQYMDLAIAYELNRAAQDKE
jgi:uncharacterized membrane protein/protein-disulfide isomerase